jgi:NAD-dependent deacetylase
MNDIQRGDKVEIPEPVVEKLRAARSVAVLTGAGVSAESGVPTFREAQTGLWEKYNPEELATPGAFRRDPAFVWKWYLFRRDLVSQAEPNPGHIALAEIERQVEEFTLITQNVDGLHRRAGSTNVIEVHGNILKTRCFDCAQRVPDDTVIDPDVAIPRCESCGGLLRPDVVWFGEMLPGDAVERATLASRGCDLFLTIGTSALVYPAAAIPFEALTAGAAVVEVNPQATPFTPRATHAIHAPSGLALPALVTAAWSKT